MKRISIRMRVTLWFTALMSLLALLVLVFLYLAGQSSVKTGLRNQLVNTITSSLDEIEYDDGVIEPDDDLDYFIGGVYLSIYDDEGRLLYGRIPSAYNGRVNSGFVPYAAAAIAPNKYPFTFVFNLFIII